MRETATFGPDTTTADVLAGIDLHGKVALITGGSSGLGQETARALAEKGAHVILTARDLPKGEAVAAGIRDTTGNRQVEVEELELGSLASIRRFAQRLLARHDTLHILINNAGVMACPFAKTADGFEMQFGTNHLGHFLMTGLLLPALRRGASRRQANIEARSDPTGSGPSAEGFGPQAGPAERTPAAGRIVSVSSRGHHLSPVVFDDLNFERRPYHNWLSYGQAKTANVLFAVGLERRLASHGVHAVALHPGAIITELGRHLQAADFEFLSARNSGMKFKSVEAGAATSVFAATAPELEGRGGLYLEDCHIAAINDADNALNGVKSYALDPQNAERLWEVSEQLVGERIAVV